MMLKHIKTLSTVVALSATLMAGAAHAALLDLTTFTVGTTAGGSASTSSNYATLNATSWITASVSGVTSFDWFFQSNDYLPYNDYAYFGVNGTNTTLASVSTVGNYGNSGWMTYDFGSAFSGTLTFGAVNVGDTALDSQLFIKNVTAVPEPATLVLFGLGLAGLGFSRRKHSS